MYTFGTGGNFFLQLFSIAQEESGQYQKMLLGVKKSIQDGKLPTL